MEASLGKRQLSLMDIITISLSIVFALPAARPEEWELLTPTPTLPPVVMQPFPVPPLYSPQGPPKCPPPEDIPETPGYCVSCRESCGQQMHGAYSCSCDRLCVAYGDCCNDFRLQCPAESDASLVLTDNFKYIRSLCRNDWKREDDTESIYHRENSLVSVCGRTGQACYTPEESAEPPVDLLVPVVDRATGVHYINAKCAACNNAVDPAPWPLNVVCLNETVADQVRGGQGVETEEHLHKLTRQGCYLMYDIRSLPTLRKCVKHIISTCSPNCQDQELVRQCQSEYQSVRFSRREDGRSVLYKNVYCGLCQGKPIESIQCRMLLLNTLSGAESERPTFPVRLFFDKRKGLVIEGRSQAQIAGQVTPTEAQCRRDPGYNYKWLQDERTCHAVTCPSKTHLVGRICLPDVEEIGLEVRISTSVSEISPDVGTTFWNQSNDLQEWTRSKITELLTPLVSHTDQITPKVVFSGFPNITVNIGILAYFHRHSDRSIVENVNVVKEALMPWLQETFEEVASSITPKGPPLPEGPPVLVEISFSEPPRVRQPCTWLLYEESQYNVSGDVLSVLNTTRSYMTGTYELDTFDAVVCVSCEEDGAGSDCLSKGSTYSNGLSRLLAANIVLFVIVVVCCVLLV